MKKRKLCFDTPQENGGESLSFHKNTIFFSLVEKVTREVRLEIRRRLSCSETMSLCSDIPNKSYGWNIGGIRKGLTSREAISLVLYISEINEDWAILLREEINEMCYLKRYQGMWIKVHKLNKLYRLEHKVYRLLEEGYSENEIFGNYIKLGYYRLKKINLYDPNRGPIVYPIRKRGYNDHGSRQEDHRWLPKDVFLGPNPERKDFRHLVGKTKETLFDFLWG